MGPDKSSGFDMNTVLSALGATNKFMGGQAGVRDSKFSARQYDRNANAIRAAGAEEAREIRRQNKLAISSARANMAAMGGVTDDATAVSMLGDIETVGTTNVLSALYESEVKADAENNKASAIKFSARSNRAGATINALTDIGADGYRSYQKYKGSKNG